MPEVSLMLCLGIPGRKSPRGKGRGMEQPKGIPSPLCLSPLIGPEIPARPVSDPSPIPAGGTDHPQYVSALSSLRPR